MRISPREKKKSTINNNIFEQLHRLDKLDHCTSIEVHPPSLV